MINHEVIHMHLSFCVCSVYTITDIYIDDQGAWHHHRINDDNEEVVRGDRGAYGAKWYDDNGDQDGNDEEDGDINDGNMDKWCNDDDKEGTTMEAT